MESNLHIAAFRHTVLWIARRKATQHLFTRVHSTRPLVQRFIAGEDVETAILAAQRLARQSLLLSVDFLGEDARTPYAADSALHVYLELVHRLKDATLETSAELSVKLSALGMRFDPHAAGARAASIAAAAAIANMTITVDMEDSSTTDSIIGTVQHLRDKFPTTGVVIQAALRRSPRDVTQFAYPGSRVRLCKGAYHEPARNAWQSRREIRAAYLECLHILLDAGAYPMLATHDPELIAEASSLLDAKGLSQKTHEYQMLYGVRPLEQARLASRGATVRVYLPFGKDWYPYLTRRIAERPANLSMVIRALATRR